MFELLTVVLFVWLLLGALKLVFRLTWGAAKVVASLLMVIALPLLIVSLLFVGGIALLVPLALIAIAFGVVKACV